MAAKKSKMAAKKSVFANFLENYKHLCKTQRRNYLRWSILHLYAKFWRKQNIIN